MVLPRVLAELSSWVNKCMFTAHLKKSQLPDARNWLSGRNWNPTREYDLVDTASDIVIVRFYVYTQYADFCREFKLPE